MPQPAPRDATRPTSAAVVFALAAATKRPHRDVAAASSAGRLFKVELPARSRLGQRLSRSAARPIERLLAVDQLNVLHSAAARAAGGDSREFLDRVLERLNCRALVGADDLARVPKTGPCVVVANHPFGAIEGVILASLLARVRDDFRIMANYLLRRIPELADLFLAVDPFGGSRAAATNVGPLRQAIRYVEAGHLLAIFPAGEVSHLSVRDRTVTDPAWSRTVARIVRYAEAPVVPVYFGGRNGALFQVAGLVHPRLRTALLVREVFTKRHARIDTRIGGVIPFRKLNEFPDDNSLTAYLRKRTYNLQHRARPASRAARRRPKAPVVKAALEAVIDPVNPLLLSAEVASLPAAQVLVETADHQVLIARAAQIPHTLREIGRLRERTFRATGEGTGKSTDLDTFDYDYHHLFVWGKQTRDVIGGYRMGTADTLLAAKGQQGLYTSTLFEYDPRLLERLGPSLELGRSFVREEYQRAFAPLLLLWKGVSRFCVLNPTYKYLFGAVSISNTYQSVSKQLMVRFLRLQHGAGDDGALVQARNPFRARRVSGWSDAAVRAVLKETDDVSAAVADIEPDHKGLPILVRQYLTLGAKFLAMNVDPDFSDVVDGLMLIDLTKTDSRVLSRYMGRDGYAQFMAYHAAKR